MTHLMKIFVSAENSGILHAKYLMLPFVSTAVEMKFKLSGTIYIKSLYVCLILHAKQKHNLFALHAKNAVNLKDRCT